MAVLRNPLFGSQRHELAWLKLDYYPWSVVKYNPKKVKDFSPQDILVAQDSDCDRAGWKNGDLNSTIRKWGHR